MTKTPEASGGEMPGQLDLLDEIPGETRGTEKCGDEGKNEGNEHAVSTR